MPDEVEVTSDADEVLTDEEQIERLKQKLEEGALGPYAFDREFSKYHHRPPASPGSPGQLSKSMQRSWGQNSMALTRQNPTSLDSD